MPKNSTAVDWITCVHGTTYINLSSHRAALTSEEGSKILEKSPHQISLDRDSGEVEGLPAEEHKPKRYIVDRPIFRRLAGRSDLVTFGEQNSDHVWISQLGDAAVPA